MRVIISRKGFDSSNGKCASPIFPNGDMVSMPIPAEEDSGLRFEDIQYNGKTYDQIWKDLDEKAYSTYHSKFCHLDPDIRDGVRTERIPGWKPAFGQIDAAQGYLRNQGIGAGDIFLFFGTFHFVDEKDGKISYCRGENLDFYKSSDLNVIYGYMQVKEIISDPDRIRKEYSWHPHSRFESNSNVLYLPADRLRIGGEDLGIKGCGTLKYDKKRVLTKEGYSKANWIKRTFYMPENIMGGRKNSSRTDETLFYKGIWQELALKETSAELIDWVKEILLS